MPIRFKIARRITVTSAIGLVPPKRNPKAHVFHWTLDGVERPNYIRLSWHPLTGDLLVGVVHRHAVQIPKDDPKRPFASWLRGFYFVRERVIAIRPFHWPVTPYEQFNAAVNDRVVGVFVDLVTKQLSKVKVQRDIDNRWLKANFSEYASSW